MTHEDLTQKIEEFCKLAEEDNNDLAYPAGRRNPQDALNLKEYSKKYQEVRLMIMEVKRLADIVDYKYKTVKDDKGWLSKLWDIDFHSTISDLRKVRKILENRAKDLDKFNWF